MNRSQVNTGVRSRPNPMPECYDGFSAAPGCVLFALVGAHEGKTITLRGKYHFENGMLAYVSNQVSAGMKNTLGNMGAFLLGPNYEFHPRGTSARGIIAGSGGVPEPVTEPAVEGAPAEPNTSLREVLLAGLIGKNPDHWTDAGKPKMSAVEEIYGSGDVTRADVEAAVPGLTQETALERAASSE